MVSFQSDIKPLFTEYDREQMRFAFDLWAYDDVKSSAEIILDRLQMGDMPCDDPWPPEHVELFERWMQEGMDP